MEIDRGGVLIVLGNKILSIDISVAVKSHVNKSFDHVSLSAPPSPRGLFFLLYPTSQINVFLT